MTASKDPRDHLPEELRVAEEEVADLGPEAATTTGAPADRRSRLAGKGRARPSRRSGPSGRELGLTQNPSWFVPVMCALLVLGILWTSVYYLSGGDYPVKALGDWNIGIGLALLLSGFGMATNWK